MKLIPCNTCNSTNFSDVLKKKSSQSEEFTVVKCKSCGLVQVNPQPEFEEVLKYYSNEYFTKRSDRGYDNYYSDKIRSEIERVFLLNLKDLNFFEFESSLNNEKSTIDIGCAAGYFVNFLKARGWNASGIEIAEGPSTFGKETLGLNIYQEDFLHWDTGIENTFDLITLWASIEHLHKPKETLEKIYKHLRPNGRMILSTCRYGLQAKAKGASWRYLNVPEHLYYYSLQGIISLCSKIGFDTIKHITYGSGMTNKANAGIFFKAAKMFLDRAVKWTDQGDMMALHFIKKQEG
jgi:2-polyprenyl-3-methyl-5-hydroxy-6-metoxy-1,4-benzoquinol methylase